MKKLADAALLAEQAGIPLTLENHSDYAAWPIAEMCADLKTKWIGICFDSGNPPSSLEDPVDAARVCAPFVIQTHLRDYKLVHEDYGMVYQGVALGDGDVDLVEITKILRNDSPITVFSVESAVRADPKRTPREGWLAPQFYDSPCNQMYRVLREIPSARAARLLLPCAVATACVAAACRSAAVISWNRCVVVDGAS